MKRLLLVTTSYPDQNEGAAAAGSFVADFAAELVRQDVAVTVVAPARAASVVSEQGVDVRRFAVPWLPLSTLSPMRPAHWAPIVRTLMAGQRAVDRACADRCFDHILALWALPSGAWAKRTGQRLGIPYSTWALGSDIWSLGRLPVVRGYLSRVLRSAYRRFADGYALGRDVTRLSGKECLFLPSTRTLSVPARQRPLAEAPPYRFGFLGRWHPNKGIDLLLEALNLLDESDWARIESVRIAGGGPLEGQVSECVGQLRSQGRPVELGGYLNREEATRFLQEIDYLIIPSRIESIPVVFSDAMQVGTPVIATPVGDLPELLSQYECGLQLEAVNAEKIVKGIRRSLNSESADLIKGTASAAADFRLDQAVRRLKKQADLE